MILEKINKKIFIKVRVKILNRPLKTKNNLDVVFMFKKTIELE